jgi:hypothetical protein
MLQSFWLQFLLPFSVCFMRDEDYWHSFSPYGEIGSIWS